MPANREIVAAAFTAWMNGAGYVASIFADRHGLLRQHRLQRAAGKRRSTVLITVTPAF